MPLVQRKLVRPAPAAELELLVEAGDVVYVVGPNGSGKSALLGHLAQEIPQGRLTRISAFRQNWINADSSSYTPAQRGQVRQNLSQYAQRDDARFVDHDPGAPINLLLAALLAAENAWLARFAEENRRHHTHIEEFEKQNLSPKTRLNDILKLSALTLQLEFDLANEKVYGWHPGSGLIGFSKLSGGERNVIFIARQVLTAPKDHVFIIDEPERHLHHSITAPLLNSLFKTRKDCAYIVATHEIELPASTDTARTLVLRTSIWENEVVKAFDVNLIEPLHEIPMELRRTILGARRQVLFVEGNEDSLDARLYNLLFPNTSVVPKGGIRNVIRSVSGLKDTAALHWTEAFGLIDRDNRDSSQVLRLEAQNVFALSVHSVEALFYGPISRKAIACRQATLKGKEVDELLAAAKVKALAALDEITIKQLCARRCESEAREKILSQMPKADSFTSGGTQKIEYDAAPLFQTELAHFKSLLAKQDLDGLISRYALRHGNCLLAIAQAFLFSSRAEYEDAVVTQLEHDEQFLLDSRTFFQPLSRSLGY